MSWLRYTSASVRSLWLHFIDFYIMSRRGSDSRGSSMRVSSSSSFFFLKYLSILMQPSYLLLLTQLVAECDQIHKKFAQIIDKSCRVSVVLVNWKLYAAVAASSGSDCKSNDTKLSSLLSLPDSEWGGNDVLLLLRLFLCQRITILEPETPHMHY